MSRIIIAVFIALTVKCDNLLASTGSWPSGYYSLPKPNSGCPNFWREGWLRQDVENDFKSHASDKSKFSSKFHMNATVNHDFIERRFCTKVTYFSDVQKLHPWPKGLYCIYRIQSCSYPMTEGSIRWDDEDSHNKNGYSGYLPDYDNDFAGVILYYCCHTAGKWYKPIELPTEKPFYLLPYGSRNCQRVKWAVSSLEYIVYDTEDTDNLDEFEGDHVFTDKVESLPKVYYCYYEGCQYKLKNETGSLTSQRSYPDFQYCSWSITVTAPLLISLKFHNLSVPNCEENFIDIYDGKGMEESTMLARFCGNNATSGTNIASKTNNLYIVFKSGNNSAKEDGNTSKSLGFNAKYEAFEPATSPATMTTTTGISPTTGTSPTTATYDSGNTETQNMDNKNSAIYLSIILPILAILILLGVIGGIFYWRRRNKEIDNVANVARKQIPAAARYVTHTPLPLTQMSAHRPQETDFNPVYESGETAAYEDDPGSMEMHQATDNVLYEPGNEAVESNPIYELDDDVDAIYTEPIK